jgi:hypothetical protein
MFEEIKRLTGITALIRLLHLPPVPRSKDTQISLLEKAYLMQVRLDLESKVEEVCTDPARTDVRNLNTTTAS